MAGDAPVRLLHYNNLPVSMSTVQDPSFYFDSAHQTAADALGSDGDGDGFYAEAKVAERDPRLTGRVRNYWYGNFFPDMRAWDKLVPFRGRGAGGTTVFVQFPGSELTAHMSVFPSKTYKKGHRHGPAFVIVIPFGEGYSVMWPEGKDKMTIPWHEGSCPISPATAANSSANLGSSNGR